MTTAEPRKLYKVIIYLKNGDNVSTETANLEAFQNDLQRYIDQFHDKRWWKRKARGVVYINGTPNVCLPIDHINFFTIDEKVEQ